MNIKLKRSDHVRRLQAMRMRRQYQVLKHIRKAMLFIKGRLRFYHRTGQKADSAGAPSVLIAYGNYARDILERSTVSGKFISL